MPHSVPPTGPWGATYADTRTRTAAEEDVSASCFTGIGTAG